MDVVSGPSVSLALLAGPRSNPRGGAMAETLSRLSELMLCPLALLALPSSKSICGVGLRAGEPDRLAARVAAIRDGDGEGEGEACRPGVSPPANLPALGGESIVLLPTLSLIVVVYASACVRAFCPVIWLRILPGPLPSSGDFAASPAAACVAANRAPFPPGLPPVLPVACAVLVGDPVFFRDTGDWGRSPLEPGATRTTPPGEAGPVREGVIAVAFCLLKARVAPWSAWAVV